MTESYIVTDFLYIVLLIIIIIAMYYILTIIFNNPGGITSNLSPDCDALTEGLANITDQECCNGTANTKYDAELKLNMSPDSVNYLVLCRQLCNGPVKDERCMTDDVMSEVLFNNCIISTKPEKCRGAAKPIAVSNGIPYFGTKANLDGCPTHPCRF